MCAYTDPGAPHYTSICNYSFILNKNIIITSGKCCNNIKHFNNNRTTA